MERPELTELYAGPADGRELRVDSDIEALVVGGATYRRDGDVFRHCEPSQASLPTGDVIYDEAVRLFGEAELRELLAMTAVREMLKGDKDFWQGLATQMNRKASEGTP